MKTLLIAEHNQHVLSPATRATITAALQLQQPLSILILGYQCHAVAEAASAYPGVVEILLVDHEAYQYPTARQVSHLVFALAPGYSHVLVAASSFGKNFMPRVAALLDVAQISEVVDIIDHETFARPIYAGNAIATVKSLDSCKVLTIRATAFAQAKPTVVQSNIIQRIDKVSVDNSCRCVERQTSQSERPELSSARIVVSGGRGVGSRENFKLISDLADCLGAAIGASRAAVDAGFVTNDYQVGQTGKIVAPDLYIAVGISGAIQHVAGMRESKVIVAINKDPEAPIFDIADYGLVGDLFTIVPELCQLLAARHK